MTFLLLKTFNFTQTGTGSTFVRCLKDDVHIVSVQIQTFYGSCGEELWHKTEDRLSLDTLTSKRLCCHRQECNSHHTCKKFTWASSLLRISSTVFVGMVGMKANISLSVRPFGLSFNKFKILHRNKKKLQSKSIVQTCCEKDSTVETMMTIRWTLMGKWIISESLWARKSSVNLCRFAPNKETSRNRWAEPTGGCRQLHTMTVIDF